MKIRMGFVSLLIALVAAGATAASIGPQQVLTETSSHGPAVVLGPHGSLLLCWTGSGNNLLNFEFRNPERPYNGLGKHVTSETSPHAPALAVFDGRYYVAWTGPDGRMRVMNSGDGVYWFGKVTLDETATTGPALTELQGRLYIAWRGGNGNIHIMSGNTVPGSREIAFSGKVTLGEAAQSAPALTVGPSQQLFVAWRTVNNQLTVIRGNGTSFSGQVTLGDTTTARPAIVGLNGMLVLIWEGVGNSQLNTLVSTDGGKTWGKKFTSQQTSLDGPAVAWGNVIAYTGTNSAHHLNIATLQE